MARGMQALKEQVEGRSSLNIDTSRDERVVISEVAPAAAVPQNQGPPDRLSPGRRYYGAPTGTFQGAVFSPPAVLDSGSPTHL